MPAGETVCSDTEFSVSGVICIYLLRQNTGFKKVMITYSTLMLHLSEYIHAWRGVDVQFLLCERSRACLEKWRKQQAMQLIPVETPFSVRMRLPASRRMPEESKTLLGCTSVEVGFPLITIDHWRSLGNLQNVAQVDSVAITRSHHDVKVRKLS